MLIIAAGDAEYDFTFLETQRDIQQRTMDELADAGLDNIHLNFYLTSIYDHTIFEAFSRVVQKLIPEHPTLENLLNILTSVLSHDRHRECPTYVIVMIEFSN